VYSAHLPLDVHEEVGNNAVLLRALGSSRPVVSVSIAASSWAGGATWT
jgi:putative NIF3 family GTP cyclohydrolase 1 type 2